MPETSFSKKTSATPAPRLPETLEAPNRQVSPNVNIFGDALVMEDPIRTDESSLQADAGLGVEGVKTEDDLFTAVSPYYKELNDFITELRLQNVSTDNVDPEQQKLINRLNNLYAPYNNWAADVAIEKQQRQEAEMRQKQEEDEAQEAMAKAEALLANVDTTDFTSLESIKSQLIALAVSLGSNVTLAAKIDAIVDRIAALNISLNKKEVTI